jgi:HlyD family secretion protein
MKKVLILLVLLGAGGAIAAVSSGAVEFGRKVATFKMEKVRRGNVHAMVSATGTIEPEEVVDVGAQVPGLILQLGRDPDGKLVDYRSPVEKGTLLAKIDDKIFTAKMLQAEANVAQAEANVEQTRAKLRQYEREWARAQHMHVNRAIPDVDYDLARSNFETTKASLEVARANVKTAQAALQEARANVEYTTIRSPVKGVVIDRRVNTGQTVIASLNAPSLFLIAKDLEHMEIWASVNEADVGQVHKGQVVRFTVAAYPRDEFSGKVSQVRLNATMNSSVVTYTVVVSIDPEDKRGGKSSDKLLPYMTANLQFEVAEQKGVLYLPNPVLRWRPPPMLVAREERGKWGPILRRRAQSDAERSNLRVTRDGKEFVTVWVQDGQGTVLPREIQVGLTDGINTEVIAGLEEGDEVVAGVERVTESTRSIIDFGNKVKKE